MSHVLVVANETVGAEELLAELRRIEDQKVSVYRVVAPAHPRTHGMGTWDQTGAIDDAQKRLDHALGVLREAGPRRARHGRRHGAALGHPRRA